MGTPKCVVSQADTSSLGILLVTDMRSRGIFVGLSHKLSCVLALLPCNRIRIDWIVEHPVGIWELENWLLLENDRLAVSKTIPSFFWILLLCALGSLYTFFTKEKHWWLCEASTVKCLDLSQIHFYSEAGQLAGLHVRSKLHSLLSCTTGLPWMSVIHWSMAWQWKRIEAPLPRDPAAPKL